jgi:TRAP-type C4-dicarboxylate transport system permease small subunit
MVVSIFIAGSVGIREKGHITIDLLPTVSKKFAKPCLIISVIASFVFAVIFLVYGIKHVIFIHNARMKMISLPIMMYWFYLVLPICGFFMIFRLLESLLFNPKEQPDS